MKLFYCVQEMEKKKRQEQTQKLISSLYTVDDVGVAKRGTALCGNMARHITMETLYSRGSVPTEVSFQAQNTSARSKVLSFLDKLLFFLYLSANQYNACTGLKIVFTLSFWTSSHFSPCMFTIPENSLRPYKVSHTVGNPIPSFRPMKLGRKVNI
jgi:hypothetical protein